MHATRRTSLSVIAAITAMSAGNAYGQYANWLMDIGYGKLTSEYGGSLATGSNVPVTIVESGGYPDVNDDRFTPGKTLTPRTGTLGSTSHATIVGALFFGDSSGFSQRSVAPGIANIDMYNTSWSSAYFLTPGTIGPHTSPNGSRVATHAYGEGTTLSNLSRIDWVVQADDYAQVVGSNLVSGHGNGFNSIAVAPVAGVSGSALNGSVEVSAGTPYVAGRYRPDVTGPRGTTSDAIGATGGIVALLVSRGKTTTSHHSYTARPGYTVTSGDTSEVIKAALMAGASRFTSGNLDTVNISNYRSAGNQTNNGLDKRFGAGLVNVYTSYKIIDAGEQDSNEDGALGQNGGISQYGFDYDPAFGGADSSNATATYGFKATANGKFAASLVWNLKVAGPQGEYNNFSSAATLYDLDLKLIDVTAGNAIVQSSASTIDNTENLWVDLIADHIYQMQVTTKSVSFTWDYGLAWQSSVALAPIPEPASMIALGGFAGLLLRRRR